MINFNFIKINFNMFNLIFNLLNNIYKFNFFNIFKNIKILP